ncbi:hypothetical protein ACHAXR_003474 [Thalassiosira sp. AJA248-18]
MSSESNDLSPYELARLVRIKRNEERLRSLGLIGNSVLKPVKPIKKAKNAPRKRRNQTPASGIRSSKRLKNLKEGKKIVEDAKDSESSGGEEDVAISTPEEKVNYSAMPKEPDQLDDSEFQVYVALRAWRLQRKNELEVEPYKICQNKTLCELIRRRRNDARFASRQNSICEGDDSKNIKGINNMEAAVERDLLSVWGIGPSKAAKDGFGWEMLDVLDSEESIKLLQLSRKKSTAEHD